jgi:hypothetical protein
MDRAYVCVPVFGHKAMNVNDDNNCGSLSCYFNKYVLGIQEALSAISKISLLFQRGTHPDGMC